MIRQLCPHCVQLVELPDAAAGTEAACPKCGRPFKVPGTYTPTVGPDAGPRKEPTAVPDPSPADRPPPPPGLVPPPPAGAAAPPTPAGYERSCGAALHPGVLAWVPVGCLTLVLVLSVFGWVGSFPGGVRVYTQNAWQTLFADFTPHTTQKELLGDEEDLTKRVTTCWWMLPYLLLLLATTGLAWAERLLRDPDPTRLPGPIAWLPTLWPHRFALLNGLTALLLILLLTQWSRGFGLDTAIREKVAERFAEAWKTATNSSEKQLLTVQSGQELAKYGLQTTTAFAWVLAAHVVAVVALLGRTWLARRGTKPPPRAEVYW